MRENKIETKFIVFNSDNTKEDNKDVQMLKNEI